MKRINRYKVHLIIGLIFFPFLVISALTGFFRANHHWFWKENYKKVKNTTYDYKVTVPGIPLDSVFKIIQNKYGTIEEITGISLNKESGKPYYHIKLSGKHPLLIDADNGLVQSPISKETAQSLALQFVTEGMRPVNIYPDDDYRERKSHKLHPVYVIEFDDPLHTKIYLDRNDGEIVEEADDNLAFGFWMVKLHEFDFLNSKRLIMSFVGGGIFFLSLTGFYLWLRKKPIKKRKPKAAEIITRTI